MAADLTELGEQIERKLRPAAPHVIGVGGAVAVGKSTVAGALASWFASQARQPVVVATDAFLFSNATLAARDLLYRKGFPESYDWDAIVAFLRNVKSGANDIEIPVYSHEIYDIDPDHRALIDSFDLVIFEGVVALQSPSLALLDVAVYVDAAEDDVRAWFAERFVSFVDEARAGASSFYRMFAHMTPDEVLAAAHGTWDAINGPNLRDHISKTREQANLVVTKGRDHSVLSVIEL